MRPLEKILKIEQLNWGSSFFYEVGQNFRLGIPQEETLEYFGIRQKFVLDLQDEGILMDRDRYNPEDFAALAVCVRFHKAWAKRKKVREIRDRLAAIVPQPFSSKKIHNKHIYITKKTHFILDAPAYFAQSNEILEISPEWEMWNLVATGRSRYINEKGDGFDAPDVAKAFANFVLKHKQLKFIRFLLQSMEGRELKFDEYSVDLKRAGVENPQMQNSFKKVIKIIKDGGIISCEMVDGKAILPKNSLLPFLILSMWPDNPELISLIRSREVNFNLCSLFKTHEGIVGMTASKISDQDVKKIALSWALPYIKQEKNEGDEWQIRTFDRLCEAVMSSVLINN
jgi:hypothetical protein